MRRGTDEGGSNNSLESFKNYRVFVRLEPNQGTNIGVGTRLTLLCLDDFRLESSKSGVVSVDYVCVYHDRLRCRPVRSRVHLE